VTIAAGFVHKDGVLLSSESRVESDSSKELGWKILPLNGDWGDGLVAYAGTVDVAVSAIQKFDRKLKRTKPENILEELEQALEKEWKRKVFAHPLYGEDDCPDYQLLLAIRPQGEISRLYVTSETTIHEVNGFRCIGSGADLATHLLGPTMLGNMDEERVACLAAYVLAEVKRSVPGCDGLSIFRSLRNDGTEKDYFGQALPKFVEIIAQEFDRDVGLLLMSTFCDDDKNFEWNVDVFPRRIRHLRARWLEARKTGITTTIDEVPRPQ
jgi:ATP-dependent protease HslVU (ClpYQ) peptidase subunit